MIALNRLALIIFAMLLSYTSVDLAYAQSPKTNRSIIKPKTEIVNSLNNLQPKEEANKTTKNGSGWNGSYVGVNAGTSFGATAGTNVVIPLGSDSDK